ncbi:MAG: enoyl-CoA hydratase, partial [Magnetospirillum sp.]
MVEMMHNMTFAEIKIGDSATLTRTCSMKDVELFGVATGDLNPTHYSAESAEKFAHHRKVLAHSMWGGSLLSALLGNELPGPGTVYRSQDIEFETPVEVGDSVTVTVTVTEKSAPTTVVFDCLAVNQKGETLFTGRARVQAPLEKVIQPRMELQEVALRRRHHVFEDIIARCADLAPISVAVCHPCDQVSL